MAPSVDEVRNYMQGSKFSLEQVLQAVEIASRQSYGDIPNARKAYDALACHIIRQGYCKKSSCYYRTGLTKTLLELVLVYSKLSEGGGHFKSTEETIPSHEQFQKRLAIALSDTRKRRSYVEREIADFLYATRSTSCYYLSELPGRYLHLLLETDPIEGEVIQ